MADGAQKIVAAANFEAAFLAAQQAFKGLKKDTQGQQGRGKYAPLNKVNEALIPVLNEHGITVRQPPRLKDDLLVIDTLLTHVATGECSSSEYPVGPISIQHRDLGANLTFARRFALMSHCGIYPEGEDNGAPKERAGRERTGDTQTDYIAAVAQMEVKLLNCTTAPEVERIWNANHKLRKALERADPASLEKLDGRRKTRLYEITGKRGSLFDGGDE